MCSIREFGARTSAAIADLDRPGAGSPTAGVDYLTVRTLIEQLETVGLELLAAFDSSGAAAADGSASTAAWVRRRTGGPGRVIAADLHLARRLHTDPVRPLTTTVELLEEGRLTVGHARVIARATGTLAAAAFDTAEPLIVKAAVDLPVDVTAQVAAQVADHAEALHADEADDPAAARRAAADAGRRLHLSRCGDLWALEAMLTPETGAALQAVLEPLAILRRGPEGEPDLRTAAQRRADALGEAATMLLKADQLPTHGGQRPRLTVLVDLDTLLARDRQTRARDRQTRARDRQTRARDRQTPPHSVGDGSQQGGEGAGTGWLPDGTSLSRDAVRRFSCDARVSTLTTREPTPSHSIRGGTRADTSLCTGSADAVTGADTSLCTGSADAVTRADTSLCTRSADAVTRAIGHPVVRAALRRVAPALGGLPVEVLDAGRAQRLVTPGQRHALTVRDRGCVFPGCDRPPAWCDAHHLTHWADGGPTDLDNLALLCGRHHATVHDHHWTLTRAPDGTITAQPPP